MSRAPANLKPKSETIGEHRTHDTDTSGALLKARLAEAGHEVVSHEIIPDEPDLVAALLEPCHLIGQDAQPLARDPYAEALVARARALELWDSPQWHKLLHYRQGLLGAGFLGGGLTSEADGAGFFLSPAGKVDPLAGPPPRVAEALTALAGDAETATLSAAGVGKPLTPARRGPEILATAPAASAQLIVLLATLGVFERLIGFANFLEAILRARILIAIRMILARKLAIGTLDLVVGRLRVNAERLVVILEFHHIARL